MSTPRRKLSVKVVAGLSALLLAVLMSPSAKADPGDPVIPSQQDVQQAQQKVVQARQSVSDIEAALNAANARLQALGVAAGKASEAYDGAVYRWQQAEHTARQAQARAQQSAKAALAARNSLAGYVVSHETTSSTLSVLGTAMSATGTTSLINELAGQSTASSVLASRVEHWRAATSLARVYRAQAVRSLDAAAHAKQQAAAAKQAAEDAVAAQQSAVASVAAQKQTLVNELAQAEHTSVALAKQRAAGLERLRQERLAEKRRQEELKRKREEEQRKREEEQRRREEQRQHNDPPSNPGQPPSDPGQPPSDPGQPPSNPGNPPSGGQVAEAIAFARAQLGDPYVYGATGPDAWDCSGLTMGAWHAAGVSLPHYSVAQYLDIQHITFSELRPGDLVFWGSSSSPYSIYHVALYIGNNEIIQAPHPGEYVEVSNLNDWILPNFFGRV